jgi:pilus assembly protein CpaF
VLYDADWNNGQREYRLGFRIIRYDFNGIFQGGTAFICLLGRMDVMEKREYKTSRKPFSLVQELHYSALGYDVVKRTTRDSLMYQTMSLERAVKKVQHFLRQPQGSEQEKAAHNELLHKAVIGNPKAQEKVKAMISQWMLDQRIRLQQGIPGMSEVDTLFAEAQGLSVIEDLYKSRMYEEIEVVGTKVFCMVRGKKIVIPHRKFKNAEHVMNIQQRLVLYGHARISEQEPYCHSYLYDGSRLTMKMPPFSAEPTITIRRFIVEDVSLKNIERLGTANDLVRKILTLLVRGKANGIIAGDTGTGKTTLLHAMIDVIPTEERIITLESEFELRINEKYPERNVVALQELNDLGISMTKAFPTILRETPDRIIIGEVRSTEIVDALKACSRGHRGTWFTLHLSDPSHLKFVLYTLYIEAGLTIPFDAFEMQLGLSIDVLVYMRYLKNGIRVVDGIYTISLDSRGILQIEPIVFFEKDCWKYTGHFLSQRLKESMVASQNISEQQIEEIELSLI